MLNILKVVTAPLVVAAELAETAAEPLAELVDETVRDIRSERRRG